MNRIGQSFQSLILKLDPKGKHLPSRVLKQVFATSKGGVVRMSKRVQLENVPNRNVLKAAKLAIRAKEQLKSDIETGNVAKRIAEFKKRRWKDVEGD